MGRNRDNYTKLYEVASDQQGYFTAKQAKDAGYADNTHPFHVEGRQLDPGASGHLSTRQIPLDRTPRYGSLGAMVPLILLECRDQEGHSVLRRFRWVSFR